METGAAQSLFHRPDPFMRARPVGPLGFQDRPGGGGVCCSRRLSPIPRPLWGDPGRPWPPLSTGLALLTAVSFSNVRNAAVVCARALLARGPQVSSFRLSPFDGCTAVFRLFSYRRLNPLPLDGTESGVVMYDSRLVFWRPPDDLSRAAVSVVSGTFWLLHPLPLRGTEAKDVNADPSRLVLRCQLEPCNGCSLSVCRPFGASGHLALGGTEPRPDP